MQTFIDSNSPRHRLRFEELPRGIVKFPEHIAQAMADLAAKHNYGEEYARKSLIRNTLIWFYEGLPVAYRERPDGFEILGLGWEETARCERDPEAEVKVIQP